jgi:hypothetical protein
MSTIRFLDALKLLFAHSIPKLIPQAFFPLRLAGTHGLCLYSLRVLYLNDTIVGTINECHLHLSVLSAKFIYGSR